MRVNTKTYQELLLDLAETLQTSLQLDVVVCRSLGNGRDNGNVVALGADVVCRGNASDVDVVLASDLGLGNDELCRVGIAGAGQGVLQHADGLQDMADNLDLLGEVAGVTKDELGLGLELHLGLNAAHGGLDTNGLAALVQNLVDGGVEHVGTSVDGRQTGEALGQLAETVERVDVGGLSVASHRVSVEADTLKGLGGLSAGSEVAVVEVEGHGVADEVASASLEAELVVDILHGGRGQVKTWVSRVSRYSLQSGGK